MRRTCVHPRSGQPQARCEHGSPGAAQIPQLGLQHTLPTLHVVMPQLWLVGYWMAPSQARESQVWPGNTQVPQLELQHTAPVLHVFGPHGTLCGDALMPHTAWSQVWPGGAQVPQLSLQQTWPLAQVALPQLTPFGALGAVCPAGVAGFALGEALTTGFAAGRLVDANGGMGTSADDGATTLAAGALAAGALVGVAGLAGAAATVKGEKAFGARL